MANYDLQKAPASFPVLHKPCSLLISRIFFEKSPTAGLNTTAISLSYFTKHSKVFSNVADGFIGSIIGIIFFLLPPVPAMQLIQIASPVNKENTSYAPPYDWFRKYFIFS